MLRVVQLEGYDARYPGELSGGQQQRWRWRGPWSSSPRSSCSTSRSPTWTRTSGRRCASRSGGCTRSSASTLYVTHDQAEAMVISDRIAVHRSAGAWLQMGTADELFSQPRTRFVAGVHRQTNVVDGVASARLWWRAAASACASRPSRAGARRTGRPVHPRRTRSSWASHQTRGGRRGGQCPAREPCNAPASWATASTTRSRSPTATVVPAWRRAPEPPRRPGDGVRRQDRSRRPRSPGETARPDARAARPAGADWHVIRGSAARCPRYCATKSVPDPGDVGLGRSRPAMRPGTRPSADRAAADRTPPGTCGGWWR